MANFFAFFFILLSSILSPLIVFPPTIQASDWGVSSYWSPLPFECQAGKKVFEASVVENQDNMMASIRVGKEEMPAKIEVTSGSFTFGKGSSQVQFNPAEMSKAQTQVFVDLVKQSPKEGLVHIVPLIFTLQSGSCAYHGIANLRVKESYATSLLETIQEQEQDQLWVRNCMKELNSPAFQARYTQNLLCLLDACDATVTKLMAKERKSAAVSGYENKVTLYNLGKIRTDDQETRRQIQAFATHQHFQSQCNSPAAGILSTEILLVSAGTCIGPQDFGKGRLSACVEQVFKSSNEEAGFGAVTPMFEVSSRLKRTRWDFEDLVNEAAGQVHHEGGVTSLQNAAGELDPDQIAQQKVIHKAEKETPNLFVDLDPFYLATSNLGFAQKRVRDLWNKVQQNSNSSKYSEVIPWLEVVRKMDPTNDNGLFQLGTAAKALGKTDLATEAFSAIVSPTIRFKETQTFGGERQISEDTFENVQIQLAQLKAQKGDYAGMLPYLKQIPEQSAYYFWPLVKLTILSLSMQNRKQEAVSYIDQLLARRNNEVRLWIEKAAVQADDDIETALKTLDRWGGSWLDKLNNKGRELPPAGKVLKGYLLTLRGDRKQALDIFQTFVDQKDLCPPGGTPTDVKVDADAVFQLGLGLTILRENLPRAAEFLRCTPSEETPATQAALGLNLAQQGKWAEGLKLLQEAQEKDSISPLIAELFGDALISNKLNSDAKKQYNTAVAGYTKGIEGGKEDTRRVTNKLSNLK